MVEETAQGALRSVVAAPPGRIVFERMAAALFHGARVRRVIAAALLLLGVATLLGGMWFGWVALFAFGAMSMAWVPWLWVEAVEFAERAEGLRVLAEDWSEPGPPEVLAQRRSGILDLIERLYPPRSRG